MRASWRSVLGIAVAGRWVLTLTPPASAGQGDAAPQCDGAPAPQCDGAPAPQCDGAPAPWLDRHKSSDERVQLVLAQLTVDEKIQELGSIRDATHSRETPPIARLCVPALAMGGGGGSSHVLALYTVSPVDGIRNRVGPDVTVTYAPGADAASIPAAVDAAKAAEVAVVMVCDNEAEGRDRPSMALSAPQDDLVAAVAAANPRHQGGTGRHGRLPRRRAPGAAVHRRVRPCAGHSEDEGLRGPRSGIGSGVGSHSCATSRRIPLVPTRLSPRSSSATPTRSSRLAGRPARRSPAGPTCRRRCAAGRSATPGGSSRPTPRPSPPW